MNIYLNNGRKCFIISLFNAEEDFYMKGGVLGMRVCRKACNNFIIFFILVLFALCITYSALFYSCSGYDKAETQSYESATASLHEVVSGDGDSNSDFNQKNYLSMLIGSNSEHNYSLYYDCDAVLYDDALYLMLIAAFLFIFIYSAKFLPDIETPVNLKVRLDD